MVLLVSKSVALAVIAFGSSLLKGQPHSARNHSPLSPSFFPSLLYLPFFHSLSLPLTIGIPRPTAHRLFFHVDGANSTKGKTIISDVKHLKSKHNLNDDTEHESRTKTGLNKQNNFPQKLILFICKFSQATIIVFLLMSSHEQTKKRKKKELSSSSSNKPNSRNSR
jgi:hypothetical protein